MDALLAQTYRNLDIVAVDDGSTDKSGEILDKIAATDSRLQVIHQKNAGVSRARNVALAHAKGEWIGFADSDDEFLADGVETLLQAALNAGAPMSTGGYYRCVKNKPSQRVSFSTKILRDEELIRFLVTNGKNHNYLWIRLFRAELFQGISFPEGKLYEDMFVLPKLHLAAKSCAFTEKPVYRYIIHSDSITGGLNIEKQIHALNAAEATKEMISGVYPQLTACCGTAILEVCCWLIGKITVAGKAQYPREWNRVVETFRREQKNAEVSSLYMKFAVILFHINPDLLGCAWQIYTRLKY
jgi:glycosyltransferase involved in cell wall biosynthesis